MIEANHSPWGEKDWGSWVAGVVERVQSKVEESEPDQAEDVGWRGDPDYKALSGLSSLPLTLPCCCLGRFWGDVPCSLGCVCPKPAAQLILNLHHPLRLGPGAAPGPIP